MIKSSDQIITKEGIENLHPPILRGLVLFTRGKVTKAEEIDSSKLLPQRARIYFLAGMTRLGRSARLNHFEGWMWPKHGVQDEGNEDSIDRAAPLH